MRTSNTFSLNKNGMHSHGHSFHSHQDSKSKSFTECSFEHLETSTIWKCRKEFWIFVFAVQTELPSLRKHLFSRESKNWFSKDTLVQEFSMFWGAIVLHFWILLPEHLRVFGNIKFVRFQECSRFQFLVDTSTRLHFAAWLLFLANSFFRKSKCFQLFLKHKYPFFVFWTVNLGFQRFSKNFEPSAKSFLKKNNEK